MMIKSQLIENIIRSLSHLPAKDTIFAVSYLIESMVKTLANGGRIEIRGFGSFKLRYHIAREARNPKTGEKLITEPKYTVYFKPGKEMREIINNNRHLPIQSMHVPTHPQDERVEDQ